jgi:hypothetical protein
MDGLELLRASGRASSPRGKSTLPSSRGGGAPGGAGAGAGAADRGPLAEGSAGALRPTSALTSVRGAETRASRSAACARARGGVSRRQKQK